ncbi:MAG TPA: hypothetical protein VLC07_00360 [Solirubrobacterales bacterium]|nr:hypothetical protein [Solirubrobacterales bacterium]
MRGDQQDQLRDEVQRWLAAYLPESFEGEAPDAPWPIPPPAPPRAGDPEVDRALAAAWSAWEALLRQAAAGSASRLALRQKLRERRVEEEDPARPPTLHWIAMSDTDHFFAFIATGLEEVARRVKTGDSPSWSKWSTEYSPQDLIDLVDRVASEGKGDEVLRQVRHLLSLPVWKHRYDLYSNWVFTRIVAALRKETDVQVEHTEGRIDFGFAEQRLATASAPELSVYCELRSPLRGKSRKRKEAVQPDYSILVGDAGDPAKSSVVEVECKQYKTASRENFAAALQDYARARPQAHVVLVNYGPVSERVSSGILGEVEAGVRDRCQIIGEMRPTGASRDPGTSGSEFAAAILQGTGIESSPGPMALPDEPARIDLSWNGALDLDLHLEIEDGHGAVSYLLRQVGEPAHAWLVKDVLRGPGPETVMVERWIESSYRLWVHRFDRGELDGCGAVVTLSCGTLKHTFECPKGSGPWWSVFEVDGATRELRPLGQRAEPPGGL